MSDSLKATLIDLPETIPAERITLRPYRPDDAAAILAAVGESREHLPHWVAWVDRLATSDETRDYCARCAARWMLRSDLTLGIFDARTGGFLCGTGLHEPDWQARTFEIGYRLRRNAVGRGFATESTRRLVYFAFDALDAQRVALRCDARSAASRGVAERSGFVLEGRLCATSSPRRTASAPTGSSTLSSRGTDSANLRHALVR